MERGEVGIEFKWSRAADIGVSVEGSMTAVLRLREETQSRLGYDVSTGFFFNSGRVRLRGVDHGVHARRCSDVGRETEGGEAGIEDR